MGIDLIQLPVSSSGNRYCITLTDYFSKWAEAMPIPTKEATHVADFLCKMIFRHGCPEEIISDQGREFCNQVINRLEELTGFRHRVTSAYHPQSNGLDERMNQTLKAALQKLVNDSQDDWDQLLDNVLFAYRTSRQASTKYTPFFLMYGREARLPIDITLTDSEREENTQELTLDEKVEKMIEFQKKIHDQARDNVLKAQEKQTASFQVVN